LIACNYIVIYYRIEKRQKRGRGEGREDEVSSIYRESNRGREGGPG